MHARLDIQRRDHDHAGSQVIDMQLFNGVLLALAVLVGAAIVLSVAMLAAAAVARPGQAPPGGIRRDLPEYPQPDPGRARELVLR
jgi:hypothetical protein